MKKQMNTKKMQLESALFWPIISKSKGALLHTACVIGIDV